MWFESIHPTLLGQGAEIPIYRQPLVVVVALLVSVAISIALGVAISRAFRMRDYAWKLAVIFIAMSWSSILTSVLPVKLGVDLKGGLTIVGQLVKDEDQEQVPVQQLIAKIKERLDPTGTKEIVVRALGESHIEIIIPDVEDESEADRIWDRAVSAGFLNFKIVADSQNDKSIVELAESQALRRNRDVIDSERKVRGSWVKIGRAMDKEGQRTGNYMYTPGPYHLIRDLRTGQVIPNQRSFRSDEEFTEWATSNGYGAIEILVLNDPYNVEGEDLSTVYASVDQRARPCVNFRMKSDGAKRMGRLTGRYQDRPLGIVLDNLLLSAPNINSRIQTNGTIEGEFSQQEVEDLIGILKAGKLPASINKNPVSRERVDSTIGRDLLNKGVWAIGLSFILVMVFMVVYYRFAGIVACAALIGNLVMIVAVISLIKQPLTLTGLAGLVLTVGMSVDANVLIFERIREELGKGSNLRLAIRNGFDRATVTILDANITTFITAMVLYAIGTEQIRGFCVALALGIVMSMFTAIFCARVAFEIAERQRWISKLNMMSIVGSTSFDFIGKRYVALTASIFLIVCGLVATVVLGERILGHDLRGGTTARMVFAEEHNVDEVRERLDNIDYEVNGERIEFEVSAVISDNEFAKRMFKVDSSLQPYDGEGEPPADYKTLQQLLEETFGAELAKYAVEVENVSSEPVDDNATSLNVLPSQMTPKNAEQVASANDSTPAGPVWNSATNLRDDLPADSLIAGTSEFAVIEALQDESTENQDTNETAEGSTQEGESSATDGADEDTTAQDNVPLQQYRTTKLLKFNYNVTATGIRSAMVDLARDLQVAVTEEDIVLVPADENVDPNQPSARNWEVTIVTSGENSADRLVQAVAEEYSESTYFSSLSSVGGQIARESQVKAFAAVLISLVGIVLYIWLRFQRVAFGLAAVVALVHDVLFVIGAIAVTGFISGMFGGIGFSSVRISLPVVAAFLTIIGYSLNDTIVVFDRIREVRGKNPNLTGDMINRSIGQTLGRTILTSLTTFIVVFILFIGGGDAIQGFAFALVVGVFVGTYSSIFVASPVLLWLINAGGHSDNTPPAKPAKSAT